MKGLFCGTALAFAVVVSGCDDRDQPENVANITVPSGEPYQERLLELNDMARNAVFLRALMDADRDCQEVISSVFAGRYQDAPAWSVTCRNRGEWLVLIGNDGVAQVMSRRGAEAAGITSNAAQPANQAAPAQ